MAMHYVDALYHDSLLSDTTAMYDDKGRFQSSERVSGLFFIVSL